MKKVKVNYISGCCHTWEDEGSVDVMDEFLNHFKKKKTFILESPKSFILINLANVESIEIQEIDETK